MRSRSAAGRGLIVLLGAALAVLLGACAGGGGGQTGAVPVASGQQVGAGEPPPADSATSADPTFGGAVRDPSGNLPRTAPTLAGPYPTPGTLGDKARKKLQVEAEALKKRAYFAMPKLGGANLQGAQNTLQSFGSYLLNQVDATGAHRSQVLDREWKVCSQTPKPGTRTSILALVTLRSVKLGETCPK